MKLILSALALTFAINASAHTFIGSLLENKKILDFVAEKKEEGLNLTSILDRLANEGITEDQRGARGHYILKLKKVEYIDSEDGGIEKKETVRKFDVRTDFGRVQSIKESIDTLVKPEVVEPPLVDGPN
jgi:hypothetical protein